MKQAVISITHPRFSSRLGRSLWLLAGPNSRFDKEDLEPLLKIVIPKSGEVLSEKQWEEDWKRLGSVKGRLLEYAGDDPEVLYRLKKIVGEEKLEARMSSHSLQLTRATEIAHQLSNEKRKALIDAIQSHAK